MEAQNLLIATHRRSGTHLTIDAIRNNFRSWRKEDYLVLETIQKTHPQHISFEEFSRKTVAGNRVIKLHYRFDDVDFFPAQEQELFHSLLQTSHLIYVVRNGLDVMASLYEFRKGHDPNLKNTSFSEFIREPTFDKNYPQLNKVEYWREHVLGWLDSPIRDRLKIVQYEQWIEQYKSTVKSISKHIGQASDWWSKDVRISEQSHQKKIERTWVEPRKGAIGDYLNYFSKNDLDFFWSRCEDVMSQMGYLRTDFSNA